MATTEAVNTTEIVNATMATTEAVNTTEIVNATMATTEAQNTTQIMNTTMAATTEAQNTTQVVNTTMAATTDAQNTTQEATTMTTAATVATTSQAACLDGYPSMPGPPSINIVVNGQTASLECTIQPATETGSEYNVTWTSGAFVLQSNRLTVSVVDTLSVNALPTDQKNSVIDSGVTCSVTVNNPARCTNEVSPALTASLDPFKPQVTVPENLTIYEGTSGITIQVTFGTISPDLYCYIKYNTSCTVTIQARTSTVDNSINKCVGGQVVPIVVVKSVTSNGQQNTCGGAVTSTGTGSTSSIELVVKAVSDGIVRNNLDIEIRVTRVDQISGAPQFESVLRSLQATVVSEQLSGQCRVFGDPHVQTFDRTRYANMLTGEFILYQHKTLDVEVQGFFYVTGEGSSVCGVAARAGQDVVRISKCETREDTIHPVTVRLFKKGTADLMMKVYMQGEGETFKIFLPTGATLIVRNSVDASINLYFNPSALDIGNVEGVCASFDGNTTNDLIGSNGVLDQGSEPDIFSESWRVPDGKSIYSGYEGVSALTLEAHCNCDNAGVTQCPEFGDVAYCSTNKAATKDITADLLRDSVYEQELEDQVQTARRRKRATATTSGGFTYETNPGTPASSISQAAALTNCTNAVKAMASYDTCKTYSQDAYASDLADCAFDVSRTGMYSWVEATMKNLQEACLQAISANATRWLPDPDPTNPQEPVQVDIVINQLCDNDCSGARGTCNQGICTCNEGFTGSDCSISTEATPVIQVSTTSVTCSLGRVSNCNLTVVSGINFLSPAYCHLTPITVSNSTPTIDGDTVIVDADYRSKYRVLCNMPAQRSYAVAVSNDRQRLSDVAYLVVHESCYNAQTGASGTEPRTTLKDNFCYIDNVCYSNGDKRDICQVCNPSNSQTSWSQVTGSQCAGVTPATTPDASGITTDRASGDDSEEFNSLTVIVVASCVAGLLLIFIIVFVTILYIRRQRLKAATNMSSTISEEGDSYERVFNGSFGLRTDKNLTFYNPSLTPSFEVYDNSI